mmetsp:Transcript_11326/g.12819  ORF Transcript_11326/g.12819 Transcript_11326/m.12819 type:complete len:80 (+) Transcript_11326:1301-1540(+)
MRSGLQNLTRSDTSSLLSTSLLEPQTRANNSFQPVSWCTETQLIILCLQNKFQLHIGSESKLSFLLGNSALPRKALADL